MPGLRCWTAPGVEFATRDELHDHYKSEWHQYNLKRKVANLPAVPRALFDKLQRFAAEKEEARKHVTRGNDHIKRKNRVGSEASAAPAPAPLAPGVPAPGAAPDAAMAAQAAAAKAAEREELAKRAEEEYEIDMDEMKREVNPCESFMDGHVSEDLASNLSYMQKNFGFFVPDTEFCTDLNGLFKYCTKKVRAGKLCIYCDRPFRSAKDAIQHMVHKSHCKIPWETEEDVDEYEEFYDYSPLAEGEDGEPMEDGEEGLSYAPRAKADVEILDTGEVLLTNRATGAQTIIGHREFRNTYKQRVRVSEPSQAVLANQKERLMLMYKKAGVDTSSALSRPMYNGGRPAWMDRKLARQQHTDHIMQKRERLRDGMAINMHIKNRQHMKKQMGAGFGVHG